MNAITSAFSAPAATALAWTLLHFLWQGAVLAAAFFLISRNARLGPSVRYASGAVTLATMLVAPVLTYLVVASDRGTGNAAGIPAVAVRTTMTDGVPPPGLESGVESATQPSAFSMTASIVGLWALGVCIFGVRLAGGWALARRLVRRSRQPVSVEIRMLAARMSARLGIDRMVRVAQSSGIGVPVIVGWLKPVVLLPAAVLAGLTPTQIEALLAHELAHVRRHDYLVNLLQSIVETLLFYHPAVWWVSRRVRIEREHCCDDLAIGVCDRIVYATALSDLAVLSAPPRPALAATGGPLLERIRRIVEPAGHTRNTSSGWLPAFFLVILGGAMVPILLASDAPAASGAQSGSVAGTVSGNTEPGQRGVRGRAVEAVVGGIPGGVTGGVKGGVPAGAAGGVADGVTGGVVEGVIGGIPGGVIGGADVEHGRASAERDAQAVTSEQQQRELAARMDALQQESRQRVAEIQKQLQALELERINSRAARQVAQLSAELEALKNQQAEVKKLVDTGLRDQAELAQVQSRMAALKEQIAAVTSERTLEAKELALRAAQARQQAELARVVEEYASVKRQSMGAELPSGTVEIGEGERIRAGDLLVIEIHGEPDVPRAYSVHEDGTIKLPLSPPLRVNGLTVHDVARELVRQLTARGLEHPSVDVRLRRPLPPGGR